MENKCPICKTTLKAKIQSPNGRDATEFSCPRCGEFILSGTLVACLPSILQKGRDADVKISHALRMMQRNNGKIELSEYLIQPILDKPLPRLQEQSGLLIRYLAESSNYPGDEIFLSPLGDHLSIIGAKTEQVFVFLLKHLIVEARFIKNFGPESSIGQFSGDRYTVTYQGWEYYETLIKGGSNYRKAFMAMKFGDPDLSHILENVFKPSAKQAGFDLFKLDDEPRAGLIDDRLRVEIQSSNFLIADLTHDNLGAYWEAGYAEGLGKPVIYTCEKEKFESTKTHFDTNHHLTVVWDRNSPEKAGDLLKATIRATLPHLAVLVD